MQQYPTTCCHSCKGWPLAIKAPIAHLARFNVLCRQGSQSDIVASWSPTQVLRGILARFQCPEEAGRRSSTGKDSSSQLSTACVCQLALRAYLAAAAGRRTAACRMYLLMLFPGLSCRCGVCLAAARPSKAAQRRPAVSLVSQRSPELASQKIRNEDRPLIQGYMSGHQF